MFDIVFKLLQFFTDYVKTVGRKSRSLPMGQEFFSVGPVIGLEIELGCR